MQFKNLAITSILASLASAQAYSNGTIVTELRTVTEYTTYCPEPTTLTITVCEESSICTASTIKVLEPQTVTITEPCIIPTTYLTTFEDLTTTVTLTCDSCSSVPAEETEPVDEPVVPQPTLSESVAPAPVPSSVSEWEGAAAQNVAGVAAGLIAVVAAFL
ncbi:hypothetical protein KGF54_002797 [Candida jiufengensis]|uniref:uncharacterized protein n=1 Tax=Candida jiufengensis TaxID=497108 RepID=UPI002224E05C|nr:uncharacterized protein KGF54_002797 [Candida jiufengensis]KAI5953425.1 hypothetical protein KGF54_002797 [Candida jiufengensis]